MTKLYTEQEVAQEIVTALTCNLAQPLHEQHSEITIITPLVRKLRQAERAAALEMAAKHLEYYADAEEKRGPIHPALVSDVDEYEGWRRTHIFQFRSAAREIRSLAPTDAPPKGEISDGYHTFNELYEHRHALFSVICATFNGWKARLHADGTMFDGWFIAGVETPQGQATYHLPLSWWSKFKCRELERAPEWDGHTPADVVNRIQLLTDALQAMLREAEARGTQLAIESVEEAHHRNMSGENWHSRVINSIKNRAEQRQLRGEG
jgi:hypothetical protein